MNTDPCRKVELSIEKIVYPGRRLARLDGRVYFTDEGLPGETVEIEIIGERSSYVEGRTTAILTPSPRRIPARCGHFLACGSYQTMPYADQLDMKKAQAREIFRSAGPASAEEIEIVPSPREWGYRNKIRFSLRGSGPETFLAYHEPGSRDAFLPTDGCFLATERSCAGAGAVLSAFRKNGIPNLAEIEVRESLSEGKILLNLFWREKRPARGVEAITDALRSEFPLAGIVSWTPRRGGRMADLVEWGSDELLERVGQTEYEIGSGSFFQINVAILPLILDAVVGAVDGQGTETVADVYGGVGTFGLALAGKVKRVFVVESISDNLRRLRANIARNGLSNVESCPGLSERWMEELIIGRGVEIVFLDPPRKGLAPDVVRALLEHPVKKIVYLSCNPATLARDIGLLKPGYAPLSLRLFDFFPQTPHIETLAVLIPR